MFSSVQVVLLFDVNSFAETCKNESELEQNVAKLKLGSLKLLTEFGAQTEKGLEVVRWACKYYDSLNFKPDTSRKDFIDFNKKSFEDFENDLTDRYCKAFDRKETGSEPSAASHHTSDSYRPHCYILKKCLQEVLLDYNWDTPDITSPVKTTRRKVKAGHNKLIPEDVGLYNTVIVWTNVPNNLNDAKEFCGCKGIEASDLHITGDDFMASIVDPSMVKSFQEDKRICLNFVNLRDCLLSNGDVIDAQVTSAIQGGLAKLSGGLHPICNIVQTVVSKIAKDEEISAPSCVFPPPAAYIAGLGVQVSWWKKAKSGRPRRPQPGPALIWEDSDGISYLKAQLEVLAVHGSCSREWGNAVVVGVVRSSAVSILAIAGGMGHLYVCHAPNTTFTTLVHVLAKYQLSMVLKLSCGGIAVLCPWAGGVGCLAVMSASGLVTPPLSNQASNKESRYTDPHLLKFVAQTVEKCLNGAPPHTSGEPSTTTKRFSANQTERWFKPLDACSDSIKQIRKKRVNRIERKAMQERLQKRYRPQIPRPLATGEIGPLDLVDITQPPADPAPAAKPTMSRAQQLVKKSHIVTAQQKVKEQRAEEEERVQATERRAAQASERARKSQALESQVLNTVSNPEDTEELVQSLLCLRDGEEMETDIFTTAQTIINLTLLHVKNTSGTNMEEGLRKVLGSGVLQTTAEISNRDSPDVQIHQYKLQTLLHLELLWVLGYSSLMNINDDNEEEESRSSSIREYHVEEIMKMLRAISLRYNPATMASFLQETVLDNYIETMGELLVEIYEELNQPLPECLRVVTGDIGSVADTRPSSVKSHGSSVLSYGSAPGSVENPGSIKSREGRRMSSRHPSLKEASKRSIVVPKVTRALSRTVSDQCRPLQAASSSNKEVADNNIRKVRRSLFDLSDGATTKPKLQRCQTFGGGSVSELRRSPRKKHKKSLTVTPKKNRTTMGPSKNSFKTPSKGSLTPDKGYTTPKSNKGGVLVPETPGEKIGQTIFNKHRILKSTGTTLVVESPDVKRVSKYTPRRLRASLTVTRRNSFYSGARSRNWERAKTQLLADRFRGHSDRRSLDLTTIQNVGNANFLFSEIVPASQSSPPKKGISKSVEEKSCLTPKRKVLDFGLDDCTKTTFEERLETMETCHKEVGDISNLSLPVFTNSPAKSTRANLTRGHLSLSPGLDLRKTPIKKVRRALSLCTPSKITRKIDQSPGKMSSCSSSKDSGVNSFKGFFTPSKDKLSQGQNNSNAVSLCQSPNTPKQNNQSVHNSDTGLSTMTPSKRVQFSLALTPSKNINLANTSQTPNNKDGSFISNPQTPKSILKTPMKTPSKTPQKSSFHSSEIFVPVAKDGINNYIKTPTKSEKGLNTPSRKIKYLSKLNVGEDPDLLPETPHTTLKNRFSPVKLDGIVSFTENEIELVSPSKGDKASSKPSVVLFNTPFRVHPVKELSEESTQKMEIGSTAANENTPNLIDADLSMVPGMGPEDVEMMSSLIFGEDIYPDSEIGAFEVSEDDEIMKFNLNCILSTLSSPQKKIDQSPLKIGCDQNEDSRSSLPEKQMPLLDLNSIFTDHTTPKKDPKFEKEYSVSPEISMDPKVRAQIERRNKEDSMYSGVDVTATQVIMKSPQVNTDDRKTESSHDFLINNVCAMRNSEALNQNTDRILNKGKKKLILNTAEGLMSASESNMSTYQAKKAKHVGEPENKLKDMCLKEMKKDTSTSEAEKKTCRKTKLSVSKETKQKICIEEAEEEIILNKSQEKVLVTENTTTIEKSKKISVKEAVEKVPTRVAENVLSRNESKMEVSAQEGEKILSGCGTTGKMSKKKLVNKDVNEEIQADVTNTVKIQSEGVSAELHSTKAAKRHYSESSDELEEDIIQENMRNKRVTSNRTDFKKRRFSERMKKSKDAEKQRNQRSCRKLITSMCELSDDDNSDDDVYLQNCKLTPQYKKRIFDEDSDFLTPVKCFTDTPFTMPLKNVENLPRIPSNESEALSWLEEYDNTKQESNDKNKMDNRFPTGNLSSDEWCKQQKIDVYLSPVGKQISAVETPSRVHRDTMTRRRPETPNDWKITKPRREKRKISEVKGDTEDDSIIIVNDIKNNIGDNETVVDEKGQTKKAKKKKRKGVKLKITKSGEHYQVSETNISNEGSDQNSSGDVKLHLSQSDSVRSNCSDNLDSSLSSNNFETPVTKRKKKNQKESESFITPYRFTRHMSRDLSITPEFFQKLITLSPKKEPDAVHNSQKLADEFLGKRIELEMMQVSKVGTDSSTAHSELENDTSTEDQPCASYPDCKRNESLNNIAEGEWSVKSVPGSPTLKTFIRLQKEKHSILLSPRIELSPLREGNIVPVNGISNCTSLDDDSEKKKPSGSSISHKHSSPLHTSNRKKSKLTDPSLLSLVHLSVSPILNNNLLEERSNSKSTSKSQVKPKSSRRLYRNRNGGHDESP